MTEELRADIKEMKADIKDLVKQGVVHNHLLKTHEARSLALQEEQKLQAQRLRPIEGHVAFVSSALKWLGAISIGFLVQALVRFAF